MTCELPEWCDESERTCCGRAKKPLVCCECRGEILIGHRYVEYKGVWSGDFEVYRFHKFCHGIMRERDDYLRRECGLCDDVIPGFGQLVASTLLDAREGGGRPIWWPEGLPITREALAKAAIENKEEK